MKRTLPHRPSRHSRPDARHAERGSVTIAAVLAVVVVFGLAMATLQFSLATTRRQAESVDRKQATFLAEVGLAEAYAGIAVGKTGNVGTQDEPAAIGDGIFWVETTDLGSDVVEVRSTAFYGTEGVTVGLVTERVQHTLASMGLFTAEAPMINPWVHLDSYDSRQGSYTQQLIDGVNLDQAVLGSNGDVKLANNCTVNGDVVCGPTSSVSVPTDSTVSGTTYPRPIESTLPPISIPAIPLAPAVSSSDPLAPVVLPPGDQGYESLSCGAHSQLVLTGPATIVVKDLAASKDAHVFFDTTGGPIDLYVENGIDLSSGSIVTIGTTVTSDVTVQVAGSGNVVDLGSKSTFFGYIYAPDAVVKVAADFEIFGGFTAKSLNISANGKMHMDIALTDPWRESVLPPMTSWHVVEVHDAVRAQDVTGLRELDWSELPLPKDAHQEQKLELVYFDLYGTVQTYEGEESGFRLDDREGGHRGVAGRRPLRRDPRPAGRVGVAVPGAHAGGGGPGPEDPVADGLRRARVEAPLRVAAHRRGPGRRRRPRPGHGAGRPVQRARRERPQDRLLPSHAGGRAALGQRPCSTQSCRTSIRRRLSPRRSSTTPRSPTASCKRRSSGTRR